MLIGLLGLNIFAQEINVYNSIPSTINLKVTAPRQPVEQVDWSKIGTDFSNQLTQIAAEREAQKQMLFDITEKSKIAVNNSEIQSYSNSFGSLLSNLKANVLETIDMEYRLLTIGRQNPYSYPSVIGTRVNSYFTMLGLLDKTNKVLNMTIQGLIEKKQYPLLKDLAILIDSFISEYEVVMLSDQRKVSRNYYESYNIRITLNSKRDNKTQSISIFQQTIEEYCNAVKLIGINDLNGISSQISLDANIQSIQNLTYGKIKIPNTLLLDAQMTRHYFDGTILNFYIFESTKQSMPQKIENQIDLTSFITQLKNSANPNSAYFGLTVDTNCVVVQINKNTTAESLKMFVGDKILTVNGVKFSKIDQLNSSNFKIGQKITITVQRGQEKKILTSLMKSNPDAIESFDINIAEKQGIMYCFKKDVEDYGELKSEIYALVAFPGAKDPLDLTMLYYIIKPSSELQKSGSKEILRLFKPLIKSMNESLVIH